MDRSKARDSFSTKNFTQIEGIHCEETFSPMVIFASIRLLQIVVAHLDLELFK